MRPYPVLNEATPTSHRTAIKKFLAYYAISLLIVFLTMVAGTYLNTYCLDADKAAHNRTHFERIFHIDSNE